MQDKIDELEEEIITCRAEKTELEKHIKEIRGDIARILEEQNKMKGFIGGVSFVFAAIGFAFDHILSWLRNG